MANHPFFSRFTTPVAPSKGPSPFGPPRYLRYLEEIRAAREAGVKPEIRPEPQSDDDAFGLRPTPTPAPPKPRAAAQATSKIPYSHPTRKAARIVAREQRVERIARYLAQGLTADEAAKRATADAYQDATRASA